MSEIRKAIGTRPYFVTLTVVGWMDVFIRKIYTEEIFNNLFYCKQNKGLDIYAYVLMSSHLHMIVQHKEGELSEVLRDFKSYTAKRLLHLIETNPQESRKEWMMHMFAYYARFKKQNKQYQFWQKTSYPIELYNPEIFEQKREYIHDNPVVAGLVEEPHHYKLSSAYEFPWLKVDEA